MRNKYVGLFLFFIMLFAVIVNCGCKTTETQKMKKDIYADMEREAAWIIKGEPIEFEGERWYPADGIESLLETEVYPVGEHRGVKFFVDKIDIRPFNRLYTLFEKHKYRFFLKEAKE